MEHDTITGIVIVVLAFIMVVTTLNFFSVKGGNGRQYAKVTANVVMEAVDALLSLFTILVLTFIVALGYYCILIALEFINISV